jgi:methylated-DNA-protein-cysteine methyltransferase-like protein
MQDDMRRPVPKQIPDVSDSYLMIWEIVRKIPRGKVATYGIARESGLPGKARLVGYALHNLPYGSDLPWHRVINARWQISFPQGSGNHRKQRTLLEHEGIMFQRDTIKLDRYRSQHGVRNSKKIKQRPTGSNRVL